MSRVESNWNPTSHRSLFHVITSLWNGITDLARVVASQLLSVQRSVPEEPRVVLMGEKMSSLVSGLPLSLTINLETVVCHVSVGLTSRLV